MIFYIECSLIVDMFNVDLADQDYSATYILELSWFAQRTDTSVLHVTFVIHRYTNYIINDIL